MLFHQNSNSHDLYDDFDRITYVSKVNHGNMIAIPNHRFTFRKRTHITPNLIVSVARNITTHNTSNAPGFLSAIPRFREWKIIVVHGKTAGRKKSGIIYDYSRNLVSHTSYFVTGRYLSVAIFSDDIKLDRRYFEI